MFVENCLGKSCTQVYHLLCGVGRIRISSQAVPCTSTPVYVLMVWCTVQSVNINAYSIAGDVLFAGFRNDYFIR